MVLRPDQEGHDIAEMRETLIFGPSFAGGAPLDPTAAVAALPDEAEICGCNGVCKGKITGAIAALGLKTLDDVRAHTKASARCGSCTGLVEQLLKSSLGDAYNPAAVQPMCPCTRSRPRRRPPPDRRQGAEVDPRADAGAGVEDVVRLCEVPAGAQLLPAVDLARRVRRRQPVALHQRARARQHPEGRHLLRRAAHVGRHDQRQGAARHRRRRREVQDPRGEVHRRPAHRHARRQEGGPAGRVGRPQRRRHGLGCRLRQGPAHGEDLRRHRLVPLRHAGLDRPRHQAREIHVGLVDAGQTQARGLRLPAQLRGGDLQGHRRDLRRVAATTSTSQAPPASTSRAPRCSATSTPRTRRSR